MTLASAQARSCTSTTSRSRPARPTRSRTRRRRPGPAGFPNVLKRPAQRRAVPAVDHADEEGRRSRRSATGRLHDHALNTSSRTRPTSSARSRTDGVDEPVTLASGASKRHRRLQPGGGRPVPERGDGDLYRRLPERLEEGLPQRRAVPAVDHADEGGRRSSKIGDKVDYTITPRNTSSADTPNLECTISDPKVGVRAVTLASGASKVVQSTTSRRRRGRSFLNTARSTCSPRASRTSSTKPPTSSCSSRHHADEGGRRALEDRRQVDYTITLANTSSADTPDLVCTISDPKVGVNEPVTLASGASKVVQRRRLRDPGRRGRPVPERGDGDL